MTLILIYQPAVPNFNKLRESICLCNNIAVKRKCTALMQSRNFQLKSQMVCTF